MSDVYYPDDAATGYKATRLAEGLAKQFSVGVLCAQPLDRARGLHCPRHEERNGVTIHRCVNTRFPKTNLALRGVNLLSFCLSLFITALRHVKSGDTVLVFSNPPLLPTVTAFLRIVLGVKVIMIAEDVYPEVLVTLGLLRRGSVAYRVLSTLSRTTLRNVDCVVVLSRDMEALIKTKVMRSQAIVVLPNWSDVEAIKPRRKAETMLSSRLGLADKWVCQISGNMGRTHAIEDVLACARLCMTSPDISFLFIGDGAKRGLIADAVGARGLTNVMTIPFVPREELVDSLNSCDIAIVPLIAGMTGVSVPCRMYNIFAAGKPIIAVAEPESEIAMLISEYRLGWVAKPGRPQGLASAVLLAKANPDELLAMGRRARSLAEAAFTFKHILAAYSSLIKAVMRASHREELQHGEIVPSLRAAESNRHWVA